LRDWLHHWHERRYQNRKDSSNKDQTDIPDGDGDYNCPDCDYASKDVSEEGSLKNVLLITGPVGVCRIISVTTVTYTRWIYNFAVVLLMS
jgi:hypothetical protein